MCSNIQRYPTHILKILRPMVYDLEETDASRDPELLTLSSQEVFFYLIKHKFGDRLLATWILYYIQECGGTIE